MLHCVASIVIGVHAGAQDSQELMDKGMERSTSLEHRDEEDDAASSIISPYERNAPPDDGKTPIRPPHSQRYTL